ncbi:hypothetical protein FJZ36_04920 [Candidatus Poribacteria bacterium]|nr:hypothetical protein [Candidatus Poribacteria bacterium]
MHVADNPTIWQKNRHAARDGFGDLDYLPRGKTSWNATLGALAFSTRRQIAGVADLNLWATMHGVSGSARYAELGSDAWVLWHGTTGERAERIAEHGLFSKGGLWTTFEPRIAHGYTRGRSRLYGAGSGMVVVVIDRRDAEIGTHYVRETEDIVRFHHGLPMDVVEYILLDREIIQIGEPAREPRSWGRARFKRQSGQWVPTSKPPVRLDASRVYDDLEGWLRESIGRLLTTLGPTAAIEAFSSLYATIHPWEALTHEAIFGALEAYAQGSSLRRGRGTSVFQLPGDTSTEGDEHRSSRTRRTGR